MSKAVDQVNVSVGDEVLPGEFEKKRRSLCPVLSEEARLVDCFEAVLIDEHDGIEKLARGDDCDGNIYRRLIGVECHDSHVWPLGDWSQPQHCFSYKPQSPFGPHDETCQVIAC